MRMLSAAKLRLILLAIVFGSVAAATSADTCATYVPRRVARVLNGTLMSDRATPLRGIRYSLDILQSPPSPGQIASLPYHGINTLHVYAERTEDGLPAGYNAASLDAIVNEAAQNGLYVIITVGGTIRTEFTTAFWTTYAGRYATRTHVIYEIENEPWHQFNPPTAQPQPQDVRIVERDIYRIIRSRAPNTPILFFSYGFLNNAAGVIADIDALESLAPELASEWWSKAAIAFHGYAGEVATAATIDGIRSARNVGLIEMELANPFPQPPGGLYFPLIHAYEQRGLSWVSFLDLPYSAATDNLNSTWNQPLMNESVIWLADCGSFPSEVAFFRSYYNYYIVAENGGGSVVNCNRVSIEPGTRFTVVDRNGDGLRSGDLVNIRASNGMYVVAEGGGGGSVNANRTRAAEWETFTIQKMTPWYTPTSGPIDYGDLVAFRSYSGYYLVAIGGGGGQLLCDRITPAQWETFQLTK